MYPFSTRDCYVLDIQCIIRSYLMCLSIWSDIHTWLVLCDGNTNQIPQHLSIGVRIRTEARTSQFDDRAIEVFRNSSETGKICLFFLILLKLYFKFNFKCLFYFNLVFLLFEFCDSLILKQDSENLDCLRTIIRIFDHFRKFISLIKYVFSFSAHMPIFLLIHKDNFHNFLFTNIFLLSYIIYTNVSGNFSIPFRTQYVPLFVSTVTIVSLWLTSDRKSSRCQTKCRKRSFLKNSNWHLYCKIPPNSLKLDRFC